MVKVAFSLLAVILLSGCSFFSAPGPAVLPLQPGGPVMPTAVDDADKKQSESDAKVAAAVAEARAQNKLGQTAKTENELSVAAAFLPTPTAADLAAAHARAERMNAEEYKAAISYGMTLQKKIDDAFNKMESDQKEAARVSALKDQEILTLQKKVEAVERDADRKLYTMAAVGLLTLGGIALALGRVMAGGGLMVSGTIVGAVPYLLNSNWFVPIIGLLALVVLFIITWHIFTEEKNGQKKG